LSDPKTYLFHKVRPNDTLGKIAKRYYGDATRADQLLAANRDSLQTASEISAGGKVKVPLPVITPEKKTA
ncbi:LysM peptidoglycan-binding domain-containing protein, partial [Brevundimonas naejangsanensis]